MTKTALTTLFCLLSLASFSIARAATPLEISMSHIAKAYHQLVLDLKTPDDASKADYVALATTMKTEAQTARGFVPKKAADLPADQQAAMVTAYQKSMDDFGAAIDVLIQDLQGGQWDAANKQLGTLRMQEDEGHKAFRNSEKMQVFKTVTPPAAAPQAAPAPVTPAPTAPAPATPPPTPNPPVQ